MKNLFNLVIMDFTTILDALSNGSAFVEKIQGYIHSYIYFLMLMLNILDLSMLYLYAF